MRLTCVTAVFNVINSGNRERLIRCVESVATLKTPHEHLIYDGGSTDGTVELLKDLERCGKMPHLRVVSEPDTGIYNALNKGVRDAQGEWFYVLGCDDYICKPEVMDALLESGINRLDHVVSRVIQESKGHTSVGGFYRRNILFGTPYCHQGVLTRTAVVREMGGFDETRHVFADYALFAKIHQAGKRIAYRKEPFAAYSMDGYSSSGHGVFPDETMSVSKVLLGVTDEDIARFRRRTYFPLQKVSPMLFHRDATLRRAAVYMIARQILWHLGYFKNRHYGT